MSSTGLPARAAESELYGLTPDVHDDCTYNFTVELQTEELMTTVKAARCADMSL
jgi:hypothetical protein